MPTAIGGGAEPRAARTRPLGVKNGAFLIEKLHDDCSPGQFIREFTKNAEEGIARLPDRNGVIVWDVALFLGAFPEYGSAPKLMVVDTGVGMSRDELLDYMNNLSSSSAVQGFGENFGVGAKISGLPLNTQGLLVCSWQGGEGWMVWLWKDARTGDYGLRPIPTEDGGYELAVLVPPPFKPAQIEDHGTMVVFLGRDPEEDTLKAPPGLPAPREWIFRYLNERFFAFPEGVQVQVRDRYDRPEDRKHFALLKVGGMRDYLAEKARASGAVVLDDVTVHWWLMREDVDLNASHYPPPGHYAAMFQNELYDFGSGRSGTAFLQSCGITFGYKHVVLYFEPTALRDVSPTISRSRLQMRGQDLPWQDWADGFRERLPQAIKDHVASHGARAAESNHSASIEERLRNIAELYRLSRYRVAPQGTAFIDTDALTPTRSTPPGGGTHRGGTTTPSERPDALMSFLSATSGTPARPVGGMALPRPVWISVADGTREPDQLTDRAAKYIPETNALLINADFRIFNDMIRHFAEQYRAIPNAAEHVRTVVHEWFEQQLVEAVMGAQSFRRAPEWDEGDLRTLWSPEALTAVVCPRYHVYNNIKRRLGSLFGGRRGEESIGTPAEGVAVVA